MRKCSDVIFGGIMRLDTQRVLTRFVGLIGLGLAASACRPSAPSTDARDSAAVPAPTDSAPGSGAASATVRSDSVLLRTDKTQYKAGEQIALTLENRSASSYAFNPCARSIEREVGGAWTAIPETDRICTMEAWILDARGTRTGNTELPSSLTAGRYRVVVRVTVETPSAAAG